MDHSISRREALTAGAVGLAALGLAGVVHAQPQAAGAAPGGMSPAELGWDAAKGLFVLPELPYAEDALEPVIDKQTMNLHRTMHHAAYVKGLNNALAKLAEIREGKGDASLIKHWSRELAFHGSGHANHCLFWTILASPKAGGGGKPSGVLAKAIDESFGSFEAFAKHFQAAAIAVEGNGWAWLVHEPASHRLYVMQGESQQNTTWWGVKPILGIDVWEHAYYLKHQNRRKDYVEKFMDVVNWARVERHLTGAPA